MIQQSAHSNGHLVYIITKQFQLIYLDIIQLDITTTSVALASVARTTDVDPGYYGSLPSLTIGRPLTPPSPLSPHSSLQVNWTHLLRETVSPDISKADDVCVSFPTYMVDLDLMLSIFSPRIVHNVILLMYRYVELWSCL